jgi:hypothetical protein
MKAVKVTITGRIPSKKNSKILVFRGKRPILLPSQAYKKWHKSAVAEVLEQGISTISNISDIQADIWFPDNIRCDLTNKAESIMDLLVDCNVLEDDRWQITGPLYLCPKGIDKENPRAEVYIRYED